MSYKVFLQEGMMEHFQWVQNLTYFYVFVNLKCFTFSYRNRKCIERNAKYTSVKES